MLTTVLKVPEWPPQASIAGAPEDFFQHCASALDSVRTFVIWSKENSSPTQIHENHGPKKMLRSGVSSTLSATTGTPLGTKLSSYK